MDRQLIDYLPEILQKYAEFKEIAKVEQPQVEELWKNIDRLLLEAFVQDESEIGAGKWEHIMGIEPFDTDTLEFRKNRIHGRMLEDVPYTYRFLCNQLETLCGDDGYAITLIKDDLILKVRVSLKSKKMISEVGSMLERSTPLNMGISIKNVLPLDLEIPAPAIKFDWFDYSEEYRGEIIAGENVLIVKTLCMHVLMSFWGSETYNGRRKYDGTMKYNSKRNYVVHVRIKSLFELYMETYIACLQVFSIFFQHRPEISVISVCNQLGITSDVLLESKLLTYMRLPFLHSDTGMQIITHRNVVRYNGTHRYNGAMKYNALYKKEEVE